MPRLASSRVTDRPRAAPRGDREAGFTLIEAMVAMMIVAMVVISYIGIRTTALIDATRARNWRLAREIAEEKLSELMAGAREVPPESGTLVPIDKYEGFSFKIVLGESAVADVESDVAASAAGDDSVANDRIEWQRDRNDYRRASARGLSAMEFEDQRTEDVNERLAQQVPSATEFEDVAVVVYFPKLEPDYPGEEEALLIKSRVSTLALSGLTPEQASVVARNRSGSTEGTTGGAAPAVEGGGR